MIESLYNTTCQIIQRGKRAEGDSWNNYDYSLSSTIPCIFSDKAGKKVKDAKGEDVYITGVFTLSSCITEVDKILFEGYEHDIIAGGISYKIDLISGKVDYYQVTVVRRRLYSENKIAVS